MNKLNQLKRAYLRWYVNTRGWRTDRQVLVLESDDWGSIRTPSNDAIDRLSLKGYQTKDFPYLKYDTLESKQDLLDLYAVLARHTDRNGNPAVITANTIISNPDFAKLKANGFSKYEYELFPETQKRYFGASFLDTFKEGMDAGVFYPQLHGMHHVNIDRWMEKLRAGDQTALDLFEEEMFDYSTSHTTIDENSFVDALTPKDGSDLAAQVDYLGVAAAHFEELFGFQSSTFIAPCYIWLPEHERALKQLGVTGIQSGAYQKHPRMGSVNVFKKEIHYTGERNALGQVYTTRNGLFEPSLFESEDVVAQALASIERAFENKKPAVLSTHRINYVSGLRPENKERTLALLDQLLAEVRRRWPDIEFMHSAALNKQLLEA